MKIKNKLILIITLSFFGVFLYGQKKNIGTFNGSIDLQSAYYFNDKKIKTTQQKEGLAINTYLNLGYTYKNFNAGLQYEIYEPPLIGYSPNLKGNKLIIGFAEYLHSKYSVRLGNMYEQFGSGLIFRAYEDRALGFNNSLLGINLSYTPRDNIRIKFIAGSPRKFLTYSSTFIYGMDVSFSLLSLLRWQTNALWNIGGGWLKRDDHSSEHSKNAPRNVNLYSIRSNVSQGLFSVGVEYVTKSSSLVITPKKGFQNLRGNAFLANLGITGLGIGGTLDFRRIEHMQLNTDDLLEDGSVALNFIPSLTKQHKYALASLFPHRVIGEGEIGGQLDIFSTIVVDEESNQSINLSLNASRYHALKANPNGNSYLFFDFGGKLLFEEIGIETHYPFSDKIETTLEFIYQKKAEFSRLNHGQMMISSQTMITDLLYKLTEKHSLRMELQHQWSDSKDDQRWAMGLLEYGFVPHLMLYGSLMSNYQTNDEESILYYTAGASYNNARLRISMGINRVRAGYQCSGGVCRYVPEHVGGIFSLNYSF